MKSIKYAFLAFSAFILFASGANASSVVTFNPNYIISDQEMLDASSMTLSEIEAFLRSKGGYISRNYFYNRDGELKSGAEIIYEGANNYDCDGVELSAKPTRVEREKKCRFAPINPKLLLVLLQKEQSLIEEKLPSQKQLDWANGYGVCDDCSMDDPTLQRFRGFGRQVNSASLQFSDYMKNPQNYGFKKGQTYTISNTGRPATVVSIENNATAALYNYTPHVYWGNFNFFKLWSKYFTRTYPNNTLMQAKGEDGVWLIKDGKRRPFLSRGALTSRYDINKVIQVDASVLESFEIGEAIKFPQYSIVRSPKGTVFLIVDEARRGFVSQEAFRKIGYNPEEIINASWDDINAYQEGSPITENSSYPTGALLQDNTTGGIFYVTEGTKAPLWDAILLKTKFKYKSITPVSPEKLASYKTVEPAIFADGEILKGQSSPAVYIIDNQTKRPVISGEAFEELGYKWSNIIAVPQSILDLYPDGEPLGAAFDEADIEIIDPNATSTDPEISTSTDELELDDQLQEEINNILNPLN